MPNDSGDVYVETLSDADGQGLRLVLHFPNRQFLAPELARAAIEAAVRELSGAVVADFKDEILKRVNFEELAHLVLTKSAERVAEKISGAVARDW